MKEGLVLIAMASFLGAMVLRVLSVHSQIVDSHAAYISQQCHYGSIVLTLIFIITFIIELISFYQNKGKGNR